MIIRLEIFDTGDTEAHRGRTSGTDNWISKSHNVVAAIHVDDFAGHATAGIGGEEDSGRADFSYFYVAAEGGALGVGFQHIAKARNAAGGESLDGTSRDRIYANVLLSQFVGEIAHRALEAGLGYGHHVV